MKLFKDINNCIKCQSPLQAYCIKPESNWTKKRIYKRCPNCLKIYQIMLTFDSPALD